MTNISKKRTSSLNYRHSKEQLLALIASLDTKTAGYFIDELLTEAERIMIVKRFAAVFMFEQGYSTYRVSTLLALSPSTTQRLFRVFAGGAYYKLLANIPTKDEHSFLKLIEDRIVAQASPRARARIMNRVLK